MYMQQKILEQKSFPPNLVHYSNKIDKNVNKEKFRKKYIISRTWLKIYLLYVPKIIGSSVHLWLWVKISQTIGTQLVFQVSNICEEGLG